MGFLITIFAGLLISLLILIIIRLIISVSSRNKNLPPGPRQLPIIGNLHLFMSNQPHFSLAQLAKTYGPFMFLRLGFKNSVVISSPVMAKEVLQKQDLLFSSRYVFDAMCAHNYDKLSIAVLPSGPLWRVLRRILTSNFLSRNNIEALQHVRRQKVKELVEYCQECSWSGKAVDLGEASFRTTLNLMLYAIFSKDLVEDPSSDSMNELKDLIKKMNVLVLKPNVVDFFPFLRTFDPQGIRRRMDAYLERSFEILNVLIDERVELRNSINKDENLIDMLITISKNNKEEIDRTHIEVLCLDLIIGGTGTTSCTLEWAMAETLRSPEATKRAKDELERVIGKGNILNEEDIKRLPYLLCIVKETLRLHPPAPLIAPRKVEQDVEVRGYTVSKDSLVFVNAWAIGRDANMWVDPLEFKPERFLDSRVDVIGRDFELIPFGGGTRVCPALPLAMRVMILILGSLLNSFDWKLEGGIRPEELNMEDRFGITLQKAYPLRAIPIPQ